MSANSSLVLRCDVQIGPKLRLKAGQSPRDIPEHVERWWVGNRGIVACVDASTEKADLGPKSTISPGQLAAFRTSAVICYLAALDAFACPDRLRPPTAACPYLQHPDNNNVGVIPGDASCDWVLLGQTASIAFPTLEELMRMLADEVPSLRVEPALGASVPDTVDAASLLSDHPLR